MTDDQELLDRAASLLSLCRDAGLTVATVEILHRWAGCRIPDRHRRLI